MQLYLMIAVGILAAAFLMTIFKMATTLRVVVPTNNIHIVQSAKTTTSYGKDQPKGNVYYRWPAWMPFIGITIIDLPVNVFSQTLNGYDAYDKDRVPFTLDIVAFYRITDSNVAAQRIVSMHDLSLQLEFILKGAIRSILASNDIQQILAGRSEFGHQFTQAVDEQLTQWGVRTVKSIELMDIRDAAGSQVIQNIMAKKKSEIEKESRIAVAENLKTAQIAEVNANQAVLVQKQEAEEAVGRRAALKDQMIGIQQQQAAQAIKEQEKETKVREMAILEVNNVRQAEIAKAQQLVAADQAKQVTIIESEAEKQKQINLADGELEAAKRNAEAITVEGNAKGQAEYAIQMAPVNAQIALAKEIGANENYQTYLVSLKQIEANRDVGIEQAKALEEADIKVISNVGTPPEGIKSVMDMFSAKGGTQIGGMLEALKNTDVGARLLNAIEAQSKPNGSTEEHS